MTRRGSDLIIGIVFMLSAFVAPAAAEVDWFRGTWQEALSAARVERRLIFADFYNQTCMPCVRMDRTTFADSTVRAAMGDLICLKLNGVSPEGRVVVAHLRIQGWPTLVVLDSTGTEIDRHIGYLAPTAFIAEIQRMRAGSGTIPDLRVRLAALPEDPHVLYELGRKLADRRDPDARSTLLHAVEACRAAGAGPADSAWWTIADVAWRDSAYAFETAACESILACCPQGGYADDVRDRLPDCYHRVGKDALAVAMLRDAARRDPEDRSTSVALGQSLWDWNIDRDEGVRLLREAALHETREPYVFMQLADMERDRGNVPGEADALRRAIALCGENLVLAKVLREQLARLQGSAAPN